MGELTEWQNPCSNKGDRLDDGHVGGTASTGDPDSWFPELWSWAIAKIKARTMLDVGCGVGFSQRFFDKSGVRTTGIDGSKMVLGRHLLKDCQGTEVLLHDFTVGPWVRSTYDIVWCCDVAEHVEAEHSQNIVDTLAKAVCSDGLLLFCAAPVGAGGYHHVNCQDPPYWIERLESAGLKHSHELSEEARGLCGPHYGRGPKNYFKRSGMVFQRVYSA